MKLSLIILELDKLDGWMLNFGLLRGVEWGLVMINIGIFCFLFVFLFVLCFVCLVLFYFILFYFILFYFILFYFILFYLFYFILFYFILFYFFLDSHLFFSWAFDGNRRLKWWAQEEKRWGGKWKYGDVVGCACDLEVTFFFSFFFFSFFLFFFFSFFFFSFFNIIQQAKTISFSLNGSFEEPMGVAFSGISFVGGVTPGITLQVYFNLIFILFSILFSFFNFFFFAGRIREQFLLYNQHRRNQIPLSSF